MPDAAALKGVNIGDKVRCAVNKTPQRQDDVQTIQRLMRRDPANAKALRKSQQWRRNRKVVRVRAGRPWHVREHCGKVVRVNPGESWTMVLAPQVAADLQSVARFLEVSKA